MSYLLEVPVMTEPSFSSTTVLVTGGAGFIGSHLVDGLLAAGADVRVLDSFATGFRRNLAHHGDRIRIVEGDIRDIAVCQQATEGAQYVFHQAALGSVPRSMKDPSTSVAVNVGGTANVFQAARDAGVRRVVYASSSSVYGDSEVLPKREGAEGVALSPYALSKQMNEQLAQVYQSCFDLEFVGLRYFNVYGPRQDPNGPYAAVVPRFISACRRGEAPVVYGDGSQTRDFTFVSDVVRANMLAALATGCSGRAYNVGAEGQTTINDLALTIARLVGYDGLPAYQPPRPGDVPHSRADTTAAREAFGFRADTPVESGLQATVAAWAGN